VHYPQCFSDVDRNFCSPSAYRREAPIGGWLYKKLLNLFFPLANISFKPNLNTVEKGYFMLQYVIFCQKMKIDGSICAGEREGQRE
jgi:hypothetical protein